MSKPRNETLKGLLIGKTNQLVLMLNNEEGERGYCDGGGGTSQIIKQKGSRGEEGRGEKREGKYVERKGKVGENGRGSRTCARSATPLAVTGALQGFFPPSSLSSLLFTSLFSFLLHSSGTGSFFSVFFRLFPFFSPHPFLSLCLSFTVSFCDSQQKADGVSPDV